MRNANTAQAEAVANEMLAAREREADGEVDEREVSGKMHESGQVAPLPPIWLLVVGMAWSAIYVLRSFMAYGTAYRKAKAGEDSGMSLFGWPIVYNLAAIIPGLGIFLWTKSKA